MRWVSERSGQCHGPGAGERPVTQPSASYDVIKGHHAKRPRIVAGATIVAQHEHVVARHQLRLQIAPGLLVEIGFLVRLAVDEHLAVMHLDALARHAHHPLDQRFGGTIGARLSSEFGTNLKGPSIRKSIGWLSLVAAALVLFQLANLLTGTQPG